MNRACCFALALAFFAGAVRADDLPQLVDRYIAWRGGAAFEQLRAVHSKGDLKIAGLSGSLETWAERDGRQRADIDLKVFKQTTVVAGTQSWDTTASGQIENAPEQAVRSAMRDSALRFADALRGRAGAHAVLAASETRDGRVWSIVHVTFGDEDSYDVLIDPKTGELGGVEVLEDRKRRFEGFGDWRMVEGVRIPFEETVKSEIPTQDSDFRLTSVELNPTFDANLFERPSAVHRASFKGGARSTKWIPFEFYADNRIFIPVKVNGHDVIAVLDSGAETSAADRAWAASIGLKSGGEVTARGAGGVDTAGLANGVRIEIGDLVLSDLTVGIFNLEPIGHRIGHPLPFIVGGDLFNELAVDIDFANRRIAFRDPASIAKPPLAVELPLKEEQGIRSVPVSVEGGPEVQFDFDLGNGSPLLIFPAYYQAHGMLQDRRTSQRLGGAVGGIHPETVATVRRITFAGVTFTDIPATFPAPENKGVDSNLSVGNVGMPIIDRFHAVIDFSHDRVWLTPDRERTAAPFVRDRLGLSLVRKDGAFEIEFVSPGSPADAAGLHAGQRVRLIDRKPPELWTESAVAGLGSSPAGTTVELTMADGVLKRVKLADYF